MKTKEFEKVLFKLHELEGKCTVCGRKDCGHSNTILPRTMDTDNVFQALMLVDEDNILG